jgi:hypothetical protein
MYKRRRTPLEPRRNVPQFRPVVEKSQNVPPNPIETDAARKATEADRHMPRPIATEATRANALLSSALKPASSSAAPKPSELIDVQKALIHQEGKNERILADISENIRKSLQARAVQHSPLPNSESKPRNTEYIRVKKEIISPHGHIRFSILKDWMSINMLAVFRRASLDWKTPDDLIAFLPAYLEPEADVLNNEVLIIGTPGHKEKLAVPIRSLDAASRLRDCFEFVTDVQAATNTPAVLLQFDADFEVVSRGIITQAVFMNAVKQNHSETKPVVDNSPEALQKSYNGALRRMESTVAADVAHQASV